MLTAFLAGLLVALALVTGVVSWFEAFVATVVLLLLPVRVRRRGAVGVGVVLGGLALLKITDIGFYAAQDRPFDPVTDWTLLGNGTEFLAGAIGPPLAALAAVGAILLAAAVLVVSTWSVLCLTRLAAAYSTALQAVVVLIAVALTAPMIVGSSVPGPPLGGGIASAAERARQISASLADQRAFASELKVDRLAGTDGSQLLTALRGKDVVVAFVESYGRDAVADPAFAPHVTGVLRTGQRRLQSRGFGMRSAFLTSPTAGGSSWLAHGTLLSGLWVDSEARYRSLVASSRLTLNAAFRRAGWRTVGFSPNTIADWPEGKFFGFERVYDYGLMDYHGPNFSWATMPDQYTLSALERFERARQPRKPVMAEIQLVSSHAPWAPIPRLVDWGKIGDGSIFGPMASEGFPPSAILTRDPARVRTDYRRSIEYSLSALLSYLETYGDDDLVMIFLGDHQPSPIVTGEGASRDVPVSVVTRDRAVLDKVNDWQWPDGLIPGPSSPVWRMDTFRDRFLTAFSGP